MHIHLLLASLTVLATLETSVTSSGTDEVTFSSSSSEIVNGLTARLSLTCDVSTSQAASEYQFTVTHNNMALTTATLVNTGGVWGSDVTQGNNDFTVDVVAEDKHASVQVTWPSPTSAQGCYYECDVKVTSQDGGVSSKSGSTQVHYREATIADLVGEINAERRSLGLHVAEANTEITALKEKSSQLEEQVVSLQDQIDGKPPGTWGEWGNFTDCSKSCGSGVRSRSRSCDTPDVNNQQEVSGRCPGSGEETENCNTQACPVDPPQQNKFTFYMTETVSYSEAQQRCLSLGQTLAMPKTPALWEELLEARQAQGVTTEASIWLGLDDLRQGGRWTWNTGAAFWREGDAASMWTKWMSGQPDEYSGGEDCGAWYTADPPATWAETDTWNDVKCSSRLPYVCQESSNDPTEPTTQSPLTTTQLPTTQSPKGVVLWRDDFNTYDASKWNMEVSMYGGMNWEFQVYTNDQKNVFVKDGMLHLQPTFTVDDPRFSEPGYLYNGKMDMNELFGTCTQSARWGCSREGKYGMLPSVMSGKVKSVPTLRFGTVEVRARIPRGDWLWPAIWMMPKHSKYGGWPASGEIDIMESRGNPGIKGVNHVSSTMHWGPTPGQNKYYLTGGKKTSDKAWSDDFHTWRLDWTRDAINTYVDGELVNSVTPQGGSFWNWGGFPGRNIWGDNKMAPFDQEFYVIFNVAVGGTNGFFPENMKSTNGAGKPWSNSSPTASQNFWEKRSEWRDTWQGDKAALIVDYIEVRSL